MASFFSQIVKRVKTLNVHLSRYELILIFLSLTVFLRLPTLVEPAWYGDENIYLAIGEAMRHGATLYKGIFDFPNKPPLIYLLAALTGSVPVFRFVLLLWLLVGMWFFYQLVVVFIPRPKARIISLITFLFLTSTPLLEGTIANAEIFFIVPTIISLWLLARLFFHTHHPHVSKKTLILAGGLLGFGFLFKIHVLLDLFAFSCFLFFTTLEFTRRRFINSLIHSPVWWLGIGFSIPVLITLILLAVSGISPLTLFVTAASSTKYISSWSLGGFISQLLTGGSLISRALILFILLGLLFFFRRRFSSPVLLIIIWFFCDLFAVLLSGRPYPHYLIQLIPSISLGVGLFITLKAKDRQPFYLIGLFLLLVLWRFHFSAYPVTSYYQNFTSYLFGRESKLQYFARFDSRTPRNYAVATYIRANSSSTETLYVWGNESELYFLSNRLPATPLVTSFHVSDLNYYQQTLTSLQETPPGIIVVMASEPRPFPELFRFLREKYLLINKITSPVDPNLPPAFVYRYLSLPLAR